MDNIEKFIQSLENRVSTISNTLNKINVVTSLESITLKLDEETVWDLSINDVNTIIKNLTGKNKLGEKEIEFLKAFANLPQEIKQLKKSFFGMDIGQMAILTEIKHKIENAKTDFSNYDVEILKQKLVQYKSLLSKLANNDMNLITEMDIVADILIKDEFSLESQVEIYKYINQVNEKVFSNYDISILGEDDEQVLSEEDLVETNLDSSLLDSLFIEFGIDWAKEDNSLTADKEKIINARNELKEKLLKYGNYDKMRELLSFIKEHDLIFVFDLPEILTKTLLFSSVEDLIKVITIAEQNDIDYHNLLKKQPVIFFPAIKENKKKKPSSISNKGPRVITGSLTNFVKNSEFLVDNGFSVNDVYSHCPVFFIRNAKTTKKIYDRLQTYGISFKYSDGTARFGFSVLNTLDVLDRLDIGIECGCYEYYQDNISKLVDPNLNLFRVKLARSNGLMDKDIFKTYKNKNGYVSRCLPEIFWKKNRDEYGKTSSDTFKKYHAINKVENISEDNLMLYETIVNNSDNDKITDMVLNDYLIEQLDVNFKEPENELIYNFNGVIISRLKVLRFYQTLISDPSITPNKEVLFYAITLFSMLNEEEVNSINQCLDTIKFKRRVLE